MFDAEAIQAFEEIVTQRESHKKAIQQVPQEPKDVYFLYSPESGWTRHVAESAAKDLTAYSTATLLAFVGDDEAVITYSRDKIVACISGGRFNDGRHHLATMPLKKTAEYQKLGEIAGKPMGHRALVRTLRQHFSEAVSVETINMLRCLDLSEVREGQSVVQVGKSTLGVRQQTDIKVNGKEVPDEIVFNISVFDADETRDARFPVRVLLETDDDEGVKFCLFPVKASLEQAEYNALQALIVPLAHQYADNDDRIMLIHADFVASRV